MPDRNNAGSQRSGPLRYAGLGIELATAVVLGALAGQWVDRKAGTGGIFTIVGVFLGFAATLYSLVRGLKGDGRPGA